LTLEILLLKALWLHAQDQPDQALEMLTQALYLSEEEGFTRLFADYGEPIAPLLNLAARQESISPKAKALLAIMAVEQPTVVKPSPEFSHLLDPLTEQEIRILRLMAAGRSNREIADELFLSANTIKVYASRMYDKLGVHRRGEAVAVAQELNLL
jgi:LuxR family maltose regulon positive regulatory protein